jgi:lipoprotein NlpI
MAWIAMLAATAALCGAEDAERLSAAREALEVARDYDRVVELLTPLLDRDPSRDENARIARSYAAAALHARGESRFRQARIDEAIRDFDREIELSPASDPHHWQRGIAYYYAGEYEKGARQFERHQTVNPQDVENAVWHFLCVVRLPGGSVEAARARLMPVDRDARVPMREIHQMFAGSISPEKVLGIAGGGADFAAFYADLYVGLYYEAIGRAEDARLCIERAAGNPSARRSYMGDVARVHARLRAREAKQSAP